MSNTIWENICNTLYWRICLMGDIIYNRNFTGKQQRWSRIWTNCRNSVEWWRCESDSCRKWITGSQNVSGETGRLFWRNSDGYHDACDRWAYCNQLNPFIESSGCYKIPILAMTAHAFKKDKEKCLAAGMNDHLPKPIEIENVKKVLCEQIKP